MRPWIFTFGGYTLHAYPFFLTLGFVAAALLGLRDAARLRQIHASPFACIVILIGALIGAHGAAILAAGRYADLWRALLFWESGLIFYGGLIGGIVTGLVYVRLAKLPLLPVADVAAPALALGEGIGRIGCLLNGCCYGAVCGWPIALTFPKHSLPYQHQYDTGLINSAAEHALPVYPTQLFMALCLIAAVPLLRALLKRPLPNGTTACAYLILQGAARLTMDAMRADMPRTVGMLTTAQVLAAGCVAAGVVGLFILYRSIDRRPEISA